MWGTSYCDRYNSGTCSKAVPVEKSCSLPHELLIITMSGNLGKIATPSRYSRDHSRPQLPVYTMYRQLFWLFWGLFREGPLILPLVAYNEYMGPLSISHPSTRHVMDPTQKTDLYTAFVGWRNLKKAVSPQNREKPTQWAGIARTDSARWNTRDFKICPICIKIWIFKLWLEILFSQSSTNQTRSN